MGFSCEASSRNKRVQLAQVVFKLQVVHIFGRRPGRDISFAILQLATDQKRVTGPAVNHRQQHPHFISTQLTSGQNLYSIRRPAWAILLVVAAAWGWAQITTVPRRPSLPKKSGNRKQRTRKQGSKREHINGAGPGRLRFVCLAGYQRW